jgi:hypothetical protein
VPQDKRRLKRHESSTMLRYQPRRVVGRWARCRNDRDVHEPVFGTDETLASAHRIRRRGVAVFPVGVELSTHGLGIEIIKKCLNMKNKLAILLVLC